MGDERKVGERDLVEQSKQTFLLREAIRDFRRKQAQYDLGREFAKTKKNRTFLVPGVIIAMLVLFSVGGVGVTFYIQQSSNRVEVDVDEFEDVNLREVLDTVERIEADITNAQRELDSLISQRDEEIEQVEAQTQRRINLVRERNLSAAQEQQEINELQAQAEQRIEEIRAGFAPRIQEVEQRISNLEERLEQYDARQVEQAREREEILNNQRQVFEQRLAEQEDFYENRIEDLRTSYESRINELESYQNDLESTLREQHAREMNALRAELTTRFNPTFEDEQLLAYLEAPIDEDLRPLLDPPEPEGSDEQEADAQGSEEASADSEDGLDTAAAEQSQAEQDGGAEGAGAETEAGATPEEQLLAQAFASYQELLGAEDIISAEQYRMLLESFLAYDQIVDRLQMVPYLNSVPPSLNQLEARAYLIAKEYERIWLALANTVRQRDEIIAARNQTIAQRNRTIEAQRAEINRFLYALESFVTVNRENGYILDPRDTSNIQVYMDRIRQVQDGTIGYVFREDDEFIGTIEFNRDGEVVTAGLVELVDDRSLQPFDKVLIQVQ